MDHRLSDYKHHHHSSSKKSDNPTATSSSTSSGISSSSRKSTITPLPSKYELQNSVSELFKFMNVCESKNFNRETISERFEKNCHRQSSKPFELFLNRLKGQPQFPEFDEQYQSLKCQNSSEVDPYVRFLVRVREDKNMSHFFNNYSDIASHKIKFQSPSHSSTQSQASFVSSSTTIERKPREQSLPQIRTRINNRSSTSLATPMASNNNHKPTRPTSATSALLNIVNNRPFPYTDDQQQQSSSLAKSKTVGSITGTKSPLKPMPKYHPNLEAHSPVGNDNNLLTSFDSSFRSIVSTASNASNVTNHRQKASSHHHHHHNHHHQNSTPPQQQQRKVPPYLSRDFHPCDWPKENDCFNTLGNYPVQEQEQLLLRDLLFVLIGIEGRFIRLTRSSESSHYKLMLDPTADYFLATTTNQILKICYSYSAIVTFVESRVYGLVNQALVASIQEHLYDYNMTICQMEESLMKNDLFLQKMFFTLSPYVPTFSLLKELCVKLYKNKSVGGSVLTLLHEKTKSIQGMDNNALELCKQMTKSAAIPYFEIMKTWIYYGEIGDPRKEFFIEDTHQPSAMNINNSFNNNPNQHSLNPQNTQQNNNNNNNLEDIESDDEYDDDFGKFNDKYWDVRYRINHTKTPCFLKKHEQIIYKTGKYVSIINKVKQLFMKSSKVIPIPQSLAAAAATGVSIQSASTTVNTMDTALMMMKNTGMVPGSSSGPTSFLFLNNPSSNTPAASGLMADNTSFASMHSSGSSSNTSHSTTGGGRGQTPAPAPSAATIFTPKPKEIYYSFDESTYIQPIISAYEEASSQLLHILIHESQLVETFNAVKHYMLLSMGDFIVHFMKFASKDLCKRTDSVVQHRLDSMMGMALGISVCAADRQYLKDDPHVEFVGKSFLKQIYQIMRPFANSQSNQTGSGFMTATTNFKDPSPSSSYLLRCDEDAEDSDDDLLDADDVALNRSIIGSVIEAYADRSPLSEVDGQSSVMKINRPHKYLNNSNASSETNKSAKKTLKNQQNLQQNQQQSSFKSKLFCYESLMLKFDVPFPLSLIFTQKSIVCYELLFRYVFLCRYAEMELEETWKDNILNVQLKRCDTFQLLHQINASSSSGPDPETTARLLAKAFKHIHKKAFALRYKMIAFVRNFHYFYAFEVIDPFFAQFIGQLTKRGSSLDSVIECHEKFLEHCFSSCFLTSIEITTIIIKIFTLCIELSHVLRDSLDVEDQSSMMESSCFFGSASMAASVNDQEKKTSSSSEENGQITEKYINKKLNQIYFSNRVFGGSSVPSSKVATPTSSPSKQRSTVKSYSSSSIGDLGGDGCTIKDIIDKANQEFDSLVSSLLKKIYSDNCEYHMMYPFVARLDYNDFYRCQILE